MHTRLNRQGLDRVQIGRLETDRAQTERTDRHANTQVYQMETHRKPIRKKRLIGYHMHKGQIHADTVQTDETGSRHAGS